MSPELKLCPLCGKAADLHEQTLLNGSIWSVSCSDDDCCGLGMPGYGTSDRTIEAWNRRPVEDALAEALTWALDKIGPPPRLIKGQNDAHVAAYAAARAALSLATGEGEGR